MTTNIKEMSFPELNTMISDLNKQIEEIKTKIEEVVSERQNRQEEAISNWKLHTAQVLEDTKILLEMGIDPHSLSPITGVDFNDGNVRDEEDHAEASSVSCENEKVVSEISTSDDIFVVEDKKEDMTDDSVLAIIPVAHVNEDKEGEENEELDWKPTDVDDGHINPILTPFYKLFKLPVIKRGKPGRKKTVDNRVNPITGIGMTTKILTPFYKLFSDKPIRAPLKLGNLQYKEKFPDPEETRVVSADGYSPTLTYTHSNFRIWIGPKYDENGNLITETIGSEMKKAA